MDFDLDEELDAVRDLAREVFSAEAATDRVREVEGSPSRHDEALWKKLASTGLIGIGIGDEHAGAGLGVAGLAVVLQEQGRCVAPVPIWSHGVAMHVIGTFAERGLALDILRGAVDGSYRIGLALEEYGRAHPESPDTVATSEDGVWRLSGTKTLVPTAGGVEHVVVSASTPDGAGLFLVDSGDAGLSWEMASVTTHDLAGDLHLQGARGVAVGAPGDGNMVAALGCAGVALAALQIGVCEGALSLATTYLSNREQFGRPLGSFQAVQHQLADCWIDLEAMRMTLWQAISDVEDSSSTEADSKRSALVAKWWSAQAGLDVVHRIQHVHGGMGVDVDYPVHRHFLWGRQIANTLGGAESALAELGSVLRTDATSPGSRRAEAR